MMRLPLGLRINPDPERSPRESIREAPRLGARGVVLDATGDFSPDRLSETGRRDLRNALKSVELTLIALHLPTRRPFDTDQDLDDRLRRADRAFALAYELGTRLVLARVGGVPPESEAGRLAIWRHAVGELGRHAEHRGIRLGIETGSEAGDVLRSALDATGSPGLAASVDPGSLIRMGIDPVAAVVRLGPWLAHAYATDATTGGRPAIANPRGFGFPAGALDWEEYLGALEEVEYRGFLTIWPEPHEDQAGQFRALADRLKRF